MSTSLNFLSFTYVHIGGHGFWDKGGVDTAQCVELLIEGDGKSKKLIFMGFLVIFA